MRTIAGILATTVLTVAMAGPANAKPIKVPDLPKPPPIGTRPPGHVICPRPVPDTPVTCIPVP